MKHLYRITIVLLLALFVVNVAHCQSENSNDNEEESFVPQILIDQAIDKLPEDLLFSILYHERDESFITHCILETCRNNYSLYRLFQSDVSDDKEKHCSWFSAAHAFMYLYMVHNEYEKALDFWLKIKNNFSFNYILLMDQALVRIQLGDFSAKSDLTFAFEMMSRNGLINDYMLDTIFTNDIAGQFKRIRYEYLNYAAYACYVKGNYEVVKDYFENIKHEDLEDTLMLAICFDKMSEEELDYNKTIDWKNRADNIFNYIIRKEESIGKFKEAPYAYLFLDKPEKAVEVMNHIIQTELPSQALNEKDSIECHRINYKAAEIYANVGKLKKARQHIKKAIEYDKNPLIWVDAIEAPLLKPIQSYVEQEVNRYINLRVSKDTIVCNIPFNKRLEDNTRSVSCKINGKTVDEILFDPGADKVQLTRAKADEIGITEDDIIDNEFSMKDANGRIVKVPLVSLKKVELGDIELENVQAVINNAPNAQLLLGCTVWNNLKVEMPSPENKGMIRLTYIKESVEIPE